MIYWVIFSQISVSESDFAQPLHSIICIFAPMKIIAYILSIYIFALNLVPCEDIGTPDNEVKTEISQAMDGDHQHQGTDLCSPFCQCHCCQIHATSLNKVDFVNSSTVISNEVFFHFDGIEKDFKNSILQPPRV
jgi:hypothetical protein